MTREELRQVQAHGVKRAAKTLRQLLTRVDEGAIDVLLRWLDYKRWRANEATEYWVYVYFLIMRFGGPEHLAPIRTPPDALPNYSAMHRWLAEHRDLTAKVLEHKAGLEERGGWVDEPMPRTKAKLVAHIQARLGDPGWRPTRELVALITAPPFKLLGGEGLHIYAALLLHGESAELGPLGPLAQHDPIVAQILLHHGVEAAPGELGEKLLTRVYQNPGDPGPRAVYADWLMEQGIARGEFIRAQLAGEAPRLSHASAKSWVGGLRDLIRWKERDGKQIEPAFEDGFLSGCSVTTLAGEASTRPEWATITVLDVTRSARKIGDYNLASLCVLGGLSSSDLPAVLTSKAAPRLQGLGLRRVIKADTGTIWDQLSQLPALRFLALGHYAVLEASLVRHPLVHRLELLTFPPGNGMSFVDVACARPGSWDGEWMPSYDELRQRMTATDGAT